MRPTIAPSAFYDTFGFSDSPELGSPPPARSPIAAADLVGSPTADGEWVHLQEDGAPADGAAEAEKEKMATLLQEMAVSVSHVAQRDLFHTLQRDGGHESGDLSAEELSDLARVGHVTLTDEELAEVLSQMDVNENGRVSIDEFRSVLDLTPGSSPYFLLFGNSLLIYMSLRMPTFAHFWLTFAHFWPTFDSLSLTFGTVRGGLGALRSQRVCGPRWRTQKLSTQSTLARWMHRYTGLQIVAHSNRWEARLCQCRRARDLCRHCHPRVGSRRSNRHSQRRLLLRQWQTSQLRR